MGLIQDALRKLREKKEQKEAYAREQGIVEEFHEKRKSANERELERWHEENRQENINRMVERLRSKRQKELWSGQWHNPLNAENIIKNDRKQLKNVNTFLHKDTVLKSKFIFKGGKKVY